MKFSPKEQIKCLNNSLYFERALFVVGPPNAGKSYQIRDMFRDVRLNNNGNRLIGTPRKKYNLSNKQLEIIVKHQDNKKRLKESLKIINKI